MEANNLQAFWTVDKSFASRGYAITEPFYPTILSLMIVARRMVCLCHEGDLSIHIVLRRNIWKPMMHV
jgi:hypothetical protein